jgi:hypothetical protein
LKKLKIGATKKSEIQLQCEGVIKSKKSKLYNSRCPSLIKEGSYCKRHNKNRLNALQKNRNKFLMENQNTICFMDCLNGLKKIPTKSVSIVICDPPYNIGKDFGNLSDKRSLKLYLKWCKL